MSEGPLDSSVDKEVKSGDCMATALQTSSVILRDLDVLVFLVPGLWMPDCAFSIHPRGNHKYRSNYTLDIARLIVYCLVSLPSWQKASRFPVNAQGFFHDELDERENATMRGNHTNETPKLQKHCFDSDFTENVIKATGPKASPRIREIIGPLIRHVHDFAREVELTMDEFLAGVELVRSLRLEGEFL